MLFIYFYCKHLPCCMYIKFCLVCAKNDSNTTQKLSKIDPNTIQKRSKTIQKRSLKGAKTTLKRFKDYANDPKMMQKRPKKTQNDLKTNQKRFKDYAIAIQKRIINERDVTLVFGIVFLIFIFEG